MHYKVILILIALLHFAELDAQSSQHGICGNTTEDQQMAELLHPNDNKAILLERRETTIYVPVKFHLAATDDGVGAIDISDVYNQLCILNRDYMASGIVFYIYNGMNKINSTTIFSSAGQNETLLISNKNPDALNIYITENANLQANQTGTVLGYYSPKGDYIVIRKKEIINLTSTLSHEVGHFFNLRHTFYGWENAAYDRTKHGEQVTFTTVPGGIPDIEVELMDKSNCLTAADLICDTPPDYNFGFGAQNCIFGRTVYDKNGDRVIPMTNNFMGYFIGCSSYLFTDLQTNRMRTNIYSASRDYLRSPYIPVLDEITDTLTVLRPNPGEKINTYDNVTLDWEDIPGATDYILEIVGQGQFIHLILPNSEYIATQLKKNSIYFWTVKPINESNGCAEAKTFRFRTGDGTWSNTKDQNTNGNIRIIPNPIQNGSLRIMSEETKSGDLLMNITDITGKTFITQKVYKSMSKPEWELDISQLPKGYYILSVADQSKILKLKFINQ